MVSAPPTKLMGDVPAPVPEDLPIVVSANADRITAVAQPLLGAVTVLALGAAVALPAYDLLSGRMIPRPWREYTAALVGGVTASVAGFLWLVSRPVWWTIDADGLTQEGPGDRRRDLRWAEVWRIQRGRHGYKFYGRSGLPPIHLPRAAIPRDRQCSVLDGIESVLRQHFDFPPPATGGFWMALARVYALLAVVCGPPILYNQWFVLPLIRSGPRTIEGWVIWVHRQVVWNVNAAGALVFVLLFAPGLLYFGIATWLVCRKSDRDTQIVPKRPGSPRAA